MAENTKTKTVNYRRCEPESTAGTIKSASVSLQEVLATVTEKGQKPWIRAIGMAGTEAQFLSHLVNKQSCICGVLLLCASRLIPLVDAHKEDGSTWEATIEPKDAQGKCN